MSDNKKVEIDLNDLSGLVIKAMSEDILNIVKRSIDLDHVESKAKEMFGGRALFKDYEILNDLKNSFEWEFRSCAQKAIADSNFNKITTDITNELLDEDDFKRVIKETMRQAMLDNIMNKDGDKS